MRHNGAILVLALLATVVLAACGGSGGGGGGGSKSVGDGVYISLSDSPPRNVDATATSATSIQVQWDVPVSGTAVGYNIYRKFGDSYALINSLAISNTSGPLTTYDDANLLQYTYYCYKVAAYDKYLTESQKSARACVTTPGIVYVLPAGQSTGVSVDTTISAAFSDQLNVSSINSGTFSVTGGATNPTGTYSFSTDGYGYTVATFTPSVSLDAAAPYTVTITNGVWFQDGRPYNTSYSWSFTTQ